jgi:hypothetical protein
METSKFGLEFDSKPKGTVMGGMLFPTPNVCILPSVSTPCLLSPGLPHPPDPNSTLTLCGRGEIQE